jgi:Lipocalin-like domain
MSAHDKKHAERFLGSWGLVSYEHALPSGEVSRPFGESPAGLILYQADGRMSAQVSSSRQTRLSSEDFLQARVEEAAEAWRTYFGYWGSFEVDAKKGVVVHRVEGSSFSNWIGTEQIRHFRFDGADRLILSTSSPAGWWTLIWQRRDAATNGCA